MKEININIQQAIPAKRQSISSIGSLLGRQYMTVESRSAYAGGDDGFEKKKMAIANGTDTGFILNRSPRKVTMKSYDVTSAVVIEDPLTHQVGIQINGEDGLFLPLTDDLVKIGDVTAEAIAAALKGERPAIFLNASKLASYINRVNQQEADNLQRMIDECSKMKQTLLNTIAENDRKAKTISDEWVSSAVKPDMSNILGGTATGVVEVNIED